PPSSAMLPRTACAVATALNNQKPLLVQLKVFGIFASLYLFIARQAAAQPDADPVRALLRHAPVSHGRSGDAVRNAALVRRAVELDPDLPGHPAGRCRCSEAESALPFQPRRQSRDDPHG